MKPREYLNRRRASVLLGFLGALVIAIGAITVLEPSPAWATNCGCPCVQDGDCHDGAVCNQNIGRCVHSDGPCDGDSDCGGGQLCNPATDTCQDPSDECSTDGDCDDGLFCNGVEFCNRFSGCKNGDLACGDGVACTVDSCDEGSDSCSHTASDAACDDGSYCSGEETCDIVSGCVGGVAIDCAGMDDFCGTGVCDEESRGCVLLGQNDGLDCAPREPDGCVLAAVCSTGACLVTPLCNVECERCDPAGCASLCGNPYGNEADTVNSTDALFSLRAAVELEVCSLCICDVNGDGQVTATDTLLMLRQVVGLGDLFFCPSGEESSTTTTSTLPQL